VRLRLRAEGEPLRGAAERLDLNQAYFFAEFRREVEKTRKSPAFRPEYRCEYPFSWPPSEIFE
jgi:hypothetical protein